MAERESNWDNAVKVLKVPPAKPLPKPAGDWKKSIVVK